MICGPYRNRQLHIKTCQSYPIKEPVACPTFHACNSFLRRVFRFQKRLVCAAKKAVSRIPVSSLKTGDEQLTGEECCAICLEPYRVSDQLRSLPCRYTEPATQLQDRLKSSCTRLNCLTLSYHWFMCPGLVKSADLLTPSEPQYLDSQLFRS